MTNKKEPETQADNSGERKNTSKRVTWKLFLHKDNRHWWFFIGGVVLAVVGYMLKGSWATLFEDILVNFGEVILVGAIIGLLSTLPTITNSYKNELIDVFYDNKHLQSHPDIDKIWERVTEALIRTKYSEKIRKMTLGKIKDVYLPDKKYHYERYNEFIEVDWLDPSEKTSIKLKSTTTFDVVSMNANRIKMGYESYNSYSEEDQKNYHISVTFDVNGEKINPKIVEWNDKDGKYWTEYGFILSGSKKYTIKREIIKHCKLKKDGAYFGGRVKMITHGMTYEIMHPEDMDVHPLDLGTTRPFDHSPTHTKSSLIKKMELDDIVMPRQGYCFFMERKE
jgi:hypothetical protein